MPRIGLISDTHGLVRPEALQLLRGCDHIVHAGDIVKPEILGALAAIAPLTAVKGNNDTGSWADTLPHDARVKVGELTIYVVHDIADVPGDVGADVVVTGHSHKPQVRRQGGVLFVNPGSAGPRRFKLPVTAGELAIDGREVTATIVDLLSPPGPP